MIDHGLRTLLLAQAGIAALVPAQTINRNTVYPIFCNGPMQGVVPPFVVITAGGGDPMLTLETFSETLKEAEIDVRSYGYSQVDAETLHKTIRQFLDDYVGAAGASDTIAAVVNWTEPVTGYEVQAEGLDSKFYFTETMYTIQYSTP